MFGKVAWSRDGKADLALEGVVDVAEWLPGAHPGQQRVDQAFGQLKREAAASSSAIHAVAPPPDDPLAAPQLRRLARALDALADEIADDGAAVAKFATKLQALDIASQVLRKLADRTA